MLKYYADIQNISKYAKTGKCNGFFAYLTLALGS